jgi:hypothetical protein
MRRFRSGVAWRALSHAGRSTAAVGGHPTTALCTASSRATGSPVAAAPVDGKAAQAGSYGGQAGSAWIHVRGIAASALRAAGEVVPPPEGQMYTGEEFNGEIDLDKKQVRSPTPVGLPVGAGHSRRARLQRIDRGCATVLSAAGANRPCTRRARRGLYACVDVARGFGMVSDASPCGRDDHAPGLGLRDWSGGGMGLRCGLLARRGFTS